jgi:transposase
METLLVGMDVSRRQHHVGFTNGDATQRWGRLIVPNDAVGAQRLATAIAEQAQIHACGAVRIGLEATGVYAWHLALWLTQHPRAESPWTVYLLQPRTVHRVTQARPSKAAKTDAQDSWNVAAVLSHPAWLPRPFSLTERTLALRALTRHRHHLIRQVTRLKNYVASYLFLKANGVVLQETLDLHTRAAEALLLEYQTVEDIAAATLTDLVTCLQTGARGHLADPTTAARAVQQAARDSFRLPGVLKEPVHQIVSWTFQDLRHLAVQLTQVEQRIAREPGARDNRLLTVPGIGPVFAAGILAEVGDIRAFPDDDQLAQFAGLTWPPVQSGTWTATDVSLARTGNGYLRHYLVEAANSVRRHDATYAAFYARKYHTSTQHAHKRALVLTARKLTRLVFALLRDDRAYDPTHQSVRRSRPRP